jgi:serine protease Do
MYDDNYNSNGYDANNNENAYNRNASNISPEQGSGEYHYVRPDTARETGYTEANYTPVNDTSSAYTPRYYYAEQESAHKRNKQKKEKRAKKGVTMPKIIAACLVCAIIGGALGAGGVAFISGGIGSEDAVAEETTTPVATDTPTATSTPIVSGSTGPITVTDGSSTEMDASAIYDLACTQTVGITTEITYTNYFGMTSSSAVSGSGFIVSSDGYIITNHHVIEDAYEGGYDVSVMLYNGETYTADIVGFEEDNDIAVLKIDAEGLDPVTIGDSDSMKVGETVYAVGNPLGELAYTMTKGMVSALDREITTSDSTSSNSTPVTINMFQIDAAVNSGNSGGPVYNSRGEVIGVVTAKYSSTGVEGIGFAIPINDAVSIANDLINYGYVSGKAYFGITVTTVSSAAAQYYNLVEGASVYMVDSDSCAAEAGLQVGDIITKIDDTEITSSSDLVNAKKDYKAGDTAVLTVYRSGETLELTIVFDEERTTTSSSGSQQEQTQQGQQSQQGTQSQPDMSDLFPFFN